MVHKISFFLCSNGEKIFDFQLFLAYVDGITWQDFFLGPFISKYRLVFMANKNTI